MASAFLRALGCDGDLGEFIVDMKGRARAKGGGHKVTGGGVGRIELESTRYPFCLEGNDKSSAGTRSIVPHFRFQQDLNRLTLRVRNLRTSKARVTWGEESREFSHGQLEAGINLAAEFSRTPFDQAFGKVLGAIAKKQEFETQMIKGMVTQFRSFPAKDDAELAAAMAKVSERLAAHQQQLDLAVRHAIEPVKHVVTVEPLE